MAFIDGFIVNLALPRMQTDFHATAEDMAWIVELYALVLGSLMLLGGALADRYGRRRIFIIGTALFAIGSIGCALAWSIPSMLALRVFQAIGGTLLVPTSLAIISAHFKGDARARAIAYWSAFGALTSTVAPLIGGVIIDTFGWRFVFWMNIPLALVVLYAAYAHISESRAENDGTTLDVPGAAYAILGLGALTYAMLESPKLGWVHFRTGGAALFGLLLLFWFVVHEMRTPAPLIPLRLFAQRTFGTINFATFLLYGALSGLMYEMPFAMIQGHGYTALQAALGTTPLGISIVLLSRPGSKLAARFGTRTMLTIGPVVVAAGMALIALLNHNTSYFTAFFPGLLLFGIGMGFVVAPLTTGVMSAADPSDVGIASGVNNTVSRIAGLLTVAAVIPILAATYNGQMNHHLAAMNATATQMAQVDAQRQRLGGARFADPAMQRASIDAFEAGFAVVAGVCACLCVLAAITDASGIREADLRPD